MMKKQDPFARASSCLAAFGLLAFAGAVHAQELSVLGGWLRADRPGESAYSWGFTYLQALDEYNALSYSWLNEGHLADNHRDGFALQYWRRASFFDRLLTRRDVQGIGTAGILDERGVPQPQFSRGGQKAGAAIAEAIQIAFQLHGRFEDRKSVV